MLVEIWQFTEIQIKKKIKLNFTNSIFYFFIVTWVGFTYYRILSLPSILSDAKLMHLFQQSVYFQEVSLLFIILILGNQPLGQ